MKLKLPFIRVICEISVLLKLLSKKIFYPNIYIFVSCCLNSNFQIKHNEKNSHFIFFISSSFINRFQNQDSIKRYIETEKIEFKKSEPKHCHKLVSQYFKDLIPKNKEYYLHQFSIKKGTNYYGLIFGTSHSLGMEKFLKVCWEKDRMAGEANFDINNDFQSGTLFYDEIFSNKIGKYNQSQIFT